RTIPTSEMTTSIIQWPENTTRSLICNVDIITDCESSRSHSALWTSISDDAYYEEGYMDRLGRDLHVDRRRTNTAKRIPPRSRSRSHFTIS
ncbi:1686_t:CDS:2, partial [Funneliformis mosseae]